MWVGDLADHFLDHVLQGDKARRTAVFIDGNDKGSLSFPQVDQQLIGPQKFRQESDRADQRLDVALEFAPALARRRRATRCLCSPAARCSCCC